MKQSMAGQSIRAKRPVLQQQCMLRLTRILQVSIQVFRCQVSDQY